MCNKVALGQEIIITKRGKPVARLIPEIATDRDEVSLAIEQIKAMRKNTTLNDLDWKILRGEGRA